MVRRLSGQADPSARVRETCSRIPTNTNAIRNTASGVALHLLLDTEPFADGLS